ncbi:retrotransposon protein, putative, ty1-copia subclass [Tanacetum coccineum]
MLMTMEPEIQQNMGSLSAYEMLQELKTLFAQAEQELLQTVKDFHSCKQEEGQSVSSYVLKIKSYIDNLERLWHPVSLNLRPKIPPPPKREDPAKDSIYHECGETGQWKRNCPQYLAELLKKKKNTALRASGLRASRKLKPGALSLYVGNGQREAVEAIGVFYLCLPSGLEIVLNNCHYAPSITRGVISVSRLYEDGFINRFVNNTIQVSRNNMVYFSAIPRDGIFEIDLSNSYANESSIYTVSNKRAKLDLDSALLWHCRLRHISKKRIEKLKPYTHQVERAKDLLGLIHTDVCGPFKIMSRQGASYFVTFTDDFSRYGYVYLLKHKHEVFETFKVFQKEVENQLGKTIKSLRSDRGGEYMSQEFLDHLKDHGIIAHHTPPYTPQHNENSLITQEAMSHEDLEIIQEEDTYPSINTSLHHEEDDLEIDEPQSDIVPIRRSIRIRHTPDRMCLYIDAEERELGDLGEPANYKATLLDLESDKWLNAMNVEMQSMKDNEVWDFDRCQTTP